MKQPSKNRLNVKDADLICYMLKTLDSLEQGNVKKSEKLTKIVNVKEENFHIF